MRTAINRELQRGNVQEIRLYFGGAEEEWALSDPELPLRKDILRWLSEKNYTVTLVVEETPQDVDLSNALASFAEFGCRIVQDQGIIDTGRLLAATGGTHGYTQWAVFDNESRIPCALWGRSEEGQHCVRQSDKTHLMPKLSGKAIAANDLRRSYGGNIHELKITDDLDGAITNFGTRFWEKVWKIRPDMNAKLSTHGALKNIQYTDRYLKSPLVVKLLGQIVLALVGVENLITPATHLVIRTAEIKAKLTPSKIEHDWQQDRQRNKVAEAYFQQGFPGQVDIDSRPVGQLPHARELRLIWESGDEWILRFDQGMGHWVPARTVYFEFSDSSVSLQAKQLDDEVFDVRARDKQHPSIVYLM